MPIKTLLLFISSFFLNLTIQAQNQIVVDLISLDICECINNDSTSQNMDDFIVNIESCIQESVLENQSVIEQVWEDTTREFGLDIIDEDFGRLLGENLSTSCPAFLEKIQEFQSNSVENEDLMDRLLYGNKLMEESNCPEAIKVYTDVIYQAKSDVNTKATAYNNRAVCRNEIGDYYRAISDLYVALELVPNFQLPYVNLAESKTFIGDYESAKSDANYALQLDSTSHQAYSVRGYTNFYLGLYDKAISDFDKSTQLDSLFADAFYGKGLVQLNLENYESAISNFKYTQTLTSIYPDLVYYLSNAYEGLGDIDQAISVFKNDSLTNTSFLKLNQIGLLYYGISEYDSSIAYYSRSIEIDSSSAQLFLNRGYAYQDSENHLSAINDFSKALELNPESEQGYLYRGISKLKLDEYDNAIKDFESVLALNDTNAEAYDYRARTHFKLENYEEAIDDYTKSIEIYNADPVVFKERGESYLKLDQTEKACSDFNKAKALDSEDVDELIAEHCKE